MHTFPTQLWDRLTSRFDLREDYSGRGMYGARCIGLTGDIGDLLRFVVACRRAAEELGLDGDGLLQMLAAAACCDYMGAGQIFYFPGLTLEPGNDPASSDTPTEP